MRHDEQFYRSILDNLDEGVYFLDADRRITFWNRGAERLTGYPAAEVVGSFCAHGILTHVDCDGGKLCGSACPATVAMRDGKANVINLFLHHKEGHRLPVEVRVMPIRDDLDRVVGVVEVFADRSRSLAVAEEMVRLKRAALLDPVTGISNRRHGEAGIEDKLAEMRRYGWQMGLVFIDLDHFKQVNDTYGHRIGDQVLRMVARTLAGSTRSFDLLCRWGGEEFLVLLTNLGHTDLERRAEALRRLVEHSCISTAQGVIAVTVSVGATLAKEEDSPESLVARADTLMYRSKKSGRNRVTVG